MTMHLPFLALPRLNSKLHFFQLDLQPGNIFLVRLLNMFYFVVLRAKIIACQSVIVAHLRHLNGCRLVRSSNPLL